MANTSIPEEYSQLQAWVHDRFAADRALNLQDYILEQTRLVDVLADGKQRSLLDVGCGGGQLAIRLRERYPYLVLVGIDLSPYLIARARQRAQRRGYAIRFEVADAQALPFSDATFNVVYSFGSAKHWPDPLKGLGECWRVLKPSGELLVADATSDAIPQEVENFYAIAHLPRLFQKPLSALMYHRMFRPARPVETYRQVAEQLQMPEGTVSHMPSIPAFLFRTRKPAA